MSPSFTFHAYALSVIDKRRICVRIDKSDLDCVSEQLSKINDKTTFKDTVVVGVGECEFDISLDWKELQDLIGVRIKINASTRRYSFYKTKLSYDDNNILCKSYIQCKGNSIIAKKITNKC